MGDGLYPILAPQQPVRPYWMGGEQNNQHWEVIQGDALAYFIQLFCDCPMIPDITDWVFVFTVKASLDPTDPNILSQVIWNEQHGACGCTALILMPVFSAGLPVGRWAFDVKSRTPGGMVRTFGRGELDVLPGADLTLSGEFDIPPQAGAPPITQPPATGSGSPVITAPAQAQAAGFTVLTFDQEPGTWDIGFGVDGHKWNAGMWWKPVPNPTSFSVDNSGILTITDLTGSGTDLCTQYHGVSGGAPPAGGTYFLGGYFEAYIYTTDWSAFWLFCADRPWVFGSGVLANNPMTWTNEIDIVETDPGAAFANNVTTTLHSNSSGDTIPDQQNANNNNHIANGPVVGAWHKYGVLWTQAKVAWYVDDVLVASSVPYASTWQPVQMILSAAPGGVNGSPSTVTPAITKVQWVRVWEPVGYVPPVVKPPGARVAAGALTQNAYARLML